ncbi:MAG: hypothetical protein KGO52_13235 [Nitrospirota bacterium]|nr:hypothetical protein [Nitrospirota bacterium]MDE3226612.1 hypothetical protein [Nitrospirota bacterium]MDE3243675.1 hypothetical protein [Nitrospirota bacterium]
MKRTWVIVLTALSLLGLAGLIALYLRLGSLIKAGVERIGPLVTKTPVSVDTVTISLLSGCATVTGLVVGNPSGYRTPRALSIGSTKVCVAPASLFGNPLIVTAVTVEQPVVTLEGLFGDSNLSRIQSNVHTFAGAADKGAKTAPAGGERRILVKEFRLTKGQVTVFLKAGLLGDRSMEMGLPDVHLRDIGRETNGAKPEELASAISTAVFNAIKRAVTG